jgi:hypothetical protein
MQCDRRSINGGLVDLFERRLAEILDQLGDVPLRRPASR